MGQGCGRDHRVRQLDASLPAQGNGRVLDLTVQGQVGECRFHHPQQEIRVEQKSKSLIAQSPLDLGRIARECRGLLQSAA